MSAPAVLRDPAASGRGRAWRALRRTPTALIGGAILVLFYAAAFAAPFLAPYAPESQSRERPHHPPSALHLKDEAGRWHWPPFVYGSALGDPLTLRYDFDPGARHALRLFVKGEPYRVAGLFTADRHLFGVEEPGRIHVLGTDALGRDVFTRLLHGARISLSVGLLGILVSYTLGLLFGGIAGYFGGWVDTLLMRLCEVLMSIPALYLILALRASFPTGMRSDVLYLVIVLILSLVVWASLARVIRGMVLALRREEYVTAAQALGVPAWRVIARHILPNTASFVIVAATLSVPGYILGEVALSFLGAGIQEPVASWGNMLQQAQSLRVLSDFPWLLAPGAAIFLTVLAFNFLGDGLRDALDPRHLGGGRP